MLKAITGMGADRYQAERKCMLRLMHPIHTADMDVRTSLTGGMMNTPHFIHTGSLKRQHG